MTKFRAITADDLMDMASYGAERRQYRSQIIAMKKHRRLSIGPFATLYFENFDTMLAQIQEMLWIEKGGPAQLADELTAYNPLVPRGRELVATLMFEIDEPDRRTRVLQELTGVENRVSLQIGDAVIVARPDQEDGVDRTKEDGKTSAIHFLHFPLSTTQIRDFTSETARVVAAIDHPNYGHMSIMTAATRQSLRGDLDIENA